MDSVRQQTFIRFIRFGLVGAGGVVVDMGMFFLLTDPRLLNWGLTLGKAFAAESAIVNNFIWNELWTFRDISSAQNCRRTRRSRFVRFNMICLAGIGISVVLLNVQVHFLHLNRYLANLIAILLSSVWNFWMNLKFGWVKPES